MLYNEHARVKACPFCGNLPAVTVFTQVNDTFWGEIWCRTKGCPVVGIAGKAATVVAAWNRRVKLPSSQIGEFGWTDFNSLPLPKPLPVSQLPRRLEPRQLSEENDSLSNKRK